VRVDKKTVNAKGHHSMWIRPPKITIVLIKLVVIFMTNTHSKAVFNNRLRMCVVQAFFSSIITKMPPVHFLRSAS